MNEETKALKKELAKLRREATQIAAEIHDIVEERLWQDFTQLSTLSTQLIQACQKVNAFKQEYKL